MVLVIVRHAESIENADKYRGFYQPRRPYSGVAAHDISRNVVGLTPRGFRQALWLGDELADLEKPHIYTSTYRRAIDTAAIAFPGLPDGWPRVTALLDEQHYGDATYMTKDELFVTFPDGAEDRRLRKHLWTPPGGGESLAVGVMARATAFLAEVADDVASGRDVIAVTHHTTILALRSLLEDRPVIDVVEEARAAKTPNGGVLCYDRAPTATGSPTLVAPVV